MGEIQPVKRNIHERILAIMADIDYICKGDKTVNGQYRFTSHDQVTGAVHPLLVKHGVTVIPTMEDMSQEGNRTRIKVRIFFSCADNPDSFFCVEYFSYGVDPSDKGPGKAISYAHKYALLKTFNIATGDDPDNDATSRFEPPKCTEFDNLVPAGVNEKMLQKFLAHSAEAMSKHVEDVKREAVNRMEDFLKGFERWSKKQKEQKEKV